MKANIELLQRNKSGGFARLGSIGKRLQACNFDHRALQPWEEVDERGNVRGTYIMTRNGSKYEPTLVNNENTTLRRDEWKLFDDGIQEAARERLTAVSDLIGSGLTYNLPNGMAHTVLETERVTDITPARVSMDPAVKSQGDLPEYDTLLLPLPIIHKDWTINLRQLQVARQMGKPLDTTMATMAARVVAEEAERLLIGVSQYNEFSYGGGIIYGYTNFPERITHVISDPSSSPWSKADLIRDILAMRQKSIDEFHRGPWMLYVAPAWDAYLDEDYSDAKGDNTVRERIQKIRGITRIETLDYLTGFQMLLVQMTSDVVREVMGLPITSLQWTDNGGMTLNFKVMAMMTPQLRADINGNTGIVHGDVE